MTADDAGEFDVNPLDDNGVPTVCDANTELVKLDADPPSSPESSILFVRPFLFFIFFLVLTQEVKTVSSPLGEYLQTVLFGGYCCANLPAFGLPLAHSACFTIYEYWRG